ncbi:MAG: indole-3-glycerol phosphate synthase TrpC [candidate division NC10 bacterium]|nr:indole-3-glycerol phosphate synthase TrpC [candidate division NC10 bacterium]
MSVGENRPARSFLERIVTHKKEEIADRSAKIPLSELKRQVRDLPPTRDFRKAIRRGGRGGKGEAPLPAIRLIAEIKRASPSRGVLRKDFDPRALAREYAASGASALSILTDASFFQGSLADLKGARDWVDLPLLQKDFLLNEYQVWEGRLWGADAILLIVALLEQEALQDLCQLALELGLEPLIEVHELRDLEKSLRARSRTIGVNNRDLKTFEVNLRTTLNLIKEIPEEKIVVSESGIWTRKEVVMLEEAGLDAILVGEALMRDRNPSRKVRELLGRS